MPKRKDRKAVVRGVAYSCAHAPYHDPEAIDWLCEQIEEFEPDYVVDLGDGLEADAGSRYPSEAAHDLLDEYEADDRLRGQIMAAAPHAAFWRIMGNHCHNLLDEHRIPKNLRRACDWRKPQYSIEGVQINKHAMQWRIAATYDYCRNRGVARLGQVTMGHGWHTDSKADAKHSVTLGCSHGLFIGGHSHRPQAVTQAMMTSTCALPYWHANAGCMRDLDPSYMRRNDKSRWGHACVVFEADLRAGPAKSPRMTRCWTAETRIRGMYNEWMDKRAGSGAVMA